MRAINLKIGNLLLATFTLTAALTGCKATGQEEAAQAPPPPQIDIAQVNLEEVVLWGTFTGRIAAQESVDIRPRVTGYIDSVTFNEGELVQQGDVLFTIDQRQYQARKQLAQAELARMQSQLDLANSEAQRANELWQRRAISQEEFEQRTAAVTAARAGVNAAAATLENAQIELEYTEIKAPISGRIGRAEITRGNLATANTSLLTTLVSVDPVLVYFESDRQMSENALSSLRTEVPVRVRLENEDGHYSGKLDFIDNQFDSRTGTLRHRAVVANPGHRLKPGQFARVEMPVSNASQAILVDQKALLTDQDRRYVYLLDDENRASRRYVSVGHSFDGLVVIDEGLADGDRVVINGLQKIAFPGMQVTPQKVDMRRTLSPPEVAINVAQ